MKKLILVLGVGLLVGTYAFAHGGDKPGPHGGSIQMPANFHTEVVGDGDRGLKIYLLDMNFEHATVENSSVSVRVMRGKTSNSLSCRVATDHFRCEAGSEKLLSTGRLLIRAKRAGTEAGMDATYELPLKGDHL